MKILRVIGSTDPSTGGPVEAMLRASEALALRGHQTEIATTDPRRSPWLKGSPFPIHALGRLTQRYVFSPSLYQWLSGNQAGFDIVIVHGVWNFSSVATWLASRRTKVPYLLFTHGMLDPWFIRAYPIKGALKRLYWDLVEKRVAQRSSAVLFTTLEEKQLAGEAFPNNSYTGVVAGYGTSRPPNEPVVQVASFARLVPSIGNKPYLLFLSRLHEKKGPDLAIKAFAAVASQHPDLQLVMAGPDHGAKAKLQNLAGALGVASRVHWPGMLQGPAKWGAYRGAASFILPSHSENFGIVVAEALACGTPVLITKRVNIWREVVSGGGGLAAEDNETSVSRMLADFLDLPSSSVDQMRDAAKSTFMRNFDIDTICKRHEAIFESAIRSASLRPRKAYPPARGAAGSFDLD